MGLPAWRTLLPIPSVATAPKAAEVGPLRPRTLGWVMSYVKRSGILSQGLLFRPLR